MEVCYGIRPIIVKCPAFDIASSGNSINPCAVEMSVAIAVCIKGAIFKVRF